MQPGRTAFSILSAFLTCACPLDVARGGGVEAVTELVLIDAGTDQVALPIVDGAVINLAAFEGTTFNVRARTDPPQVGSVVFDYDGTSGFRTETTPPYALAGDDFGDYVPLGLSTGPHTITATPYTGGGGSGAPGTPLTVSFTVVDDVAELPPIADAGRDQYLFLPASTATLSGSHVDPDGDAILLRGWTQIDGPPVAITTPAQNQTTITGLGIGDYRFRFTAEDVDGSVGFDDVVVLVRDPATTPATITGELETWHDVVLTFDGTPTSESASPNPFRDFRLRVAARHESGLTLVVPGYYAADGDAAESGASAGSSWRAHVVPSLAGEWTYVALFDEGPDVAASTDPLEGTPTQFSGSAGTFTVVPTTKTAPDLRAKGKLLYVGEHYLQHQGTGEYFLKAGANSPENFLGYHEFDDTVDQGGNANALVNGLHQYQPHVGDWSPGDPTWRGGLGKGIIGAVSYLASRGMNSIYFLTMNLEGDGQEVYPWSSPSERYRFDVSKLAQWEIVFRYMESVGIMLHAIIQEHENDQLLGGLGFQRKLYIRELLARFGHHNAIIWNLGEENTNVPDVLRGMSEYVRALDPYGHPVMVHNHPDDQQSLFTPLLGTDIVDGPSVQTYPPDVSDDVRGWRVDSAAAGRPWVVCLDETPPSEDGVVPDSVDPTHDEIRTDALWGNLIAGGAGCEWYFGYQHPHDDLDCEDWGTRENMWDLTRIAIDFFQTHVPFWEMSPRNDLVAPPARCFAKQWSTYVVQLPSGGSTTLDLDGAVGPFRVQWFDPRNGGALQDGTVSVIEGSGDLDIGLPPQATGEDWVALVTRDLSVDVEPQSFGPGSPIEILAPHPNPASDASLIPFVLDASGHVRLSVVDAQGRLVARLVDEPLGAGTHHVTWDGRSADGALAASGVYWVLAARGADVDRHRLLIVR